MKYCSAGSVQKKHSSALISFSAVFIEHLLVLPLQNSSATSIHRYTLQFAETNLH